MGDLQKYAQDLYGSQNFEVYKILRDSEQLKVKILKDEADHQNMIDFLKCEISRKIEQIKQLKLTLNDKNEEISRLNQENYNDRATFNIKINVCEEKLNRKTQEVNRINQDNQNLNRLLEKANKEIEVLNKNNLEKDEQMKILKYQNEELQIKYTKISKIDREIFDINEHVKQSDEFEKFKSQIYEEIENNGGNYKQKMDIILKMLFANQNNINKLHDKYNKEIANLTDKLMKSNERIHLFTNKFEENKIRISELNQMLNDVNEQNEQLANRYEKQNAELSKYELVKSNEYSKVLNEFFSRLNFSFKTFEVLADFCISTVNQNKYDLSNFSKDFVNFDLEDKEFPNIFSIEYFKNKNKAIQNLNINLMALKSRIGIINFKDIVDN